MNEIAVVGILILLIYTVGYFCLYLFLRYRGHDDGEAFGVSIVWPVAIFIFPLFFLGEKLSKLGRYFYELGEKHRKEKTSR